VTATTSPPSGETLRGEVESVDAERQILKNKVAVGWNLEARSKPLPSLRSCRRGRREVETWITCTSR